MALKTLLKREKIPEASIEVAITLSVLIERLLLLLDSNATGIDV